MYLLSLETASPRTRYTQEDCHLIFSSSKARSRMKKRSVILMEKILLRNNGIDTRGFCYPDVETIFDAEPEKLNNVFEDSAPKLGTEALESALQSAGLLAHELDGLIVCTCTGYLCPGLSSYIAEQAGLRPDCELLDLVGMGCGAAIPSLRTAQHLFHTNADIKVAVLAVEVCSAAFYLDDNPGVIISACLFGDGAAASIWTGQRPEKESWMLDSFQSLHVPANRQLLRFENAKGALRNRLSKRVPEEAAKAVRELFDRSMANGLAPESIILPHPGGRDVLDALHTQFSQLNFTDSRKVLRLNGNMSSPSILYVLKSYLQDSDQKETSLWLSSFGAGFSAYSCVLGKFDP